MNLRPATLKDLDAIVDLAVESVSQNPLPVNIDRGRMRETAVECISSAAHFLWVVEEDGVVCGALAAVVHPSFWYRGGQCSVLLYYARTPGAGIAVIRKFARWVKDRPMVKVAVFELEPEADPRLAKLLARLGFTRQSLNCSYVRGTA